MSRDKARKSGVGKFFFGTFIGFLLCLALIAGLGVFVYFKVSVNWINKTFKTDVSIGTEELDKKTVKDFISSAVNLGKNIDTYTFNDLKEDFGIEIGNKLMGIDITDLKSVAIKDLGSEAQDIFSNISANELKDTINFNDMSLILNKTNQYYVNNNKLFKENTFTNEVDFKYSIDDSVVIIKNNEFTINSNTVEIELWYLPLTTALGDFMNTMGDKITIGELVDKEDGFGVELPSYIVYGNEDKTINEFEDVVNDIELAEFLGYDIVNGVVKNGNEEVVGILAKLAKKTIGDLDDPINGLDNLIDTSTVAEVLGYYESEGKYYTDKELTTEVTGIMKAIAGTSIEGLKAKVEGLTIEEVLDGTTKTGVLTLIDTTQPVSKISDEIQNVISNKTLGQLADAKVIKNSDGDIITKSQLDNTKIIGVVGYENKSLSDLYVYDAINVLLTVYKITT